MFGLVLTALIIGLCGLVMIGLGVYCIKSKKPVNFYTGENGPKEEELSDPKAWNLKHGYMWIAYGAVIIITCIIGIIPGDLSKVLIPIAFGLILPIPVMIWYHHFLEKKYMFEKK